MPEKIDFERMPQKLFRHKTTNFIPDKMPKIVLMPQKILYKMP